MSEGGVLIDVHCSVCGVIQLFRVDDAQTGRAKALDYLRHYTDWNVVNDEAICPKHLRNGLRRGMTYGLMLSIPLWATVAFVVWSLLRG